MKRFALCVLVAGLLGSRALATDSLQQPTSVLPLSQKSSESLYCGEEILESDYDPNDYQWRLGRAPVRTAQKPEGSSYPTDYLESPDLTDLNVGRPQDRSNDIADALNDSDVEMDESSPAAPAGAANNYYVPVDDFYASDTGPAGNYVGPMANANSGCCGCGSGGALGCTECNGGVPSCGCESPYAETCGCRGSCGGCRSGQCCGNQGCRRCHRRGRHCCR